MKRGRGVIVVLAKEPRAGLVKTRMAPPLTLAQAADLYACLLDDVLAATAEMAAALELAPVLAVHPAEAAQGLASRVPRDFRIVAQRGRDLSQRLGWAAAEALAGGAHCALLRGSDNPTLDADSVADVLGRLEDPVDGRDVVVCPDQGGGYGLVGVRRLREGLFEHAMSTRSVLADTLANARELGLTGAAVGRSFDLDTGKDLALLAEARERGAGGLCPRTLEYLDAQELWPAG